MRADDRYELLRLLHEYVAEQRTACLHAVDIAVDLCSTITPDEFSDPLVRKAELFLDEITRLGPGPGAYSLRRATITGTEYFQVVDPDGFDIPGGLFKSEADALNFLLDHSKASV